MSGKKMETSIETIKDILSSGRYNISVIERESEVSRNYMKKIVKGDKVPSYIILALDTYFKNLGKQYG